MSRVASLLTTSGYEPVYNPKNWNKDSNIRRANCYAYAMDVLKRTEGKLQGKLQPGGSAGKKFLKNLEKSKTFIGYRIEGVSDFGSGTLFYLFQLIGIECFDVLEFCPFKQHEMEIKNEVLASAMMKLSEDYLLIILKSFFWKLSDKKLADGLWIEL